MPKAHPVIANLYKIIGEERASKAIQSLKPAATATTSGGSVSSTLSATSVTTAGLASPAVGLTPVSVAKPTSSAKKRKTATIVTPKLVRTRAGLKMKEVKQKLQFEEDTECKLFL